MLDKILLILAGYTDIIPSAFCVIILILLTIFLADWVAKVVHYFLPKKMDPALKSFIPRVVKFFFFIFGSIAAMGAAGMSTAHITGILGISTIAIGMSLKDIFTNTIQGIMILINHPFRPGDDITVSTATGSVVRIGLMYTRLDCGEEYKLVPNSKMFSEIVTIKK